MVLRLEIAALAVLRCGYLSRKALERGTIESSRNSIHCTNFSSMLIPRGFHQKSSFGIEVSLLQFRGLLQPKGNEHFTSKYFLEMTSHFKNGISIA